MASSKQVQAAKRNVKAAQEGAKKEAIPGHSKMGKWELIEAIRKAR